MNLQLVKDSGITGYFFSIFANFLCCGYTVFIIKRGFLKTDI